MKLANVDSSELAIDFNIDEAIAELKQDSNRFMYYPTIKRGDDLVSVNFEGKITTNGITSRVFKNKDDPEDPGKTAYSIGVKLSTADKEALNAIYEAVLGDLATKNGWVQKEITRSGNLYLKLRVDEDEKSFKHKSNVNVNPKALNKAPIRREQRLDAYVTLSVFINLRDKQCGALLNVDELDFIKAKN